MKYLYLYKILCPIHLVSQKNNKLITNADKLGVNCQHFVTKIWWKTNHVFLGLHSFTATTVRSKSMKHQKQLSYNQQRRTVFQKQNQQLVTLFVSFTTALCKYFYSNEYFYCNEWDFTVTCLPFLLHHLFLKVVFAYENCTTENT